MKLLITGRQGQLATALQERAGRDADVEILAVGRPEVDLELPGSVAKAIEAAAPDLVINAAAFTAVDDAEDEPERAFRVNADAAGEAAAAAKGAGARIVQISTDYVFDGAADGAYREDSPTTPLGAYGRSKLAGEEQVRAAHQGHVIVRTAWVYSPWGRNFVKTMLRLARERDEVSVVADQFGSPSSALDLADALLHMARRLGSGEAQGPGQVYHLAGSGSCSWADFAEEVFRVSASIGGPTAIVRRIATCDFPTKARRPANSILDGTKFERDFGYRMPQWQDSLPAVVERIVEHHG